MGLSENNAIALRVFPPSILKTPYLDFFKFLAWSKDEIPDFIIEEKTLIEKFYKFCLEFDDEENKFKNKKPLLASTAKEIIPKLSNIGFLVYHQNTINNINWQKLGDFYHLLKHIEKSDERKVKWALYFYFENKPTKKPQKPLQDLENLVKESNVKNPRKVISKILKIETKNASAHIEILMDLDLPLPKSHRRSLIDDLDFTSRRSPKELDAEILDLLDEGSYSNQELSTILDTSKALISKAMNRLKSNDDIVLSSHGTRGSHYYTTNCDNCPFGKDKITCRYDAEKEIKNSLKSKFDYEISDDELKSIETNQAALRIRSILKYSQKHQTPKMEININRNLHSIFTNVWANFIKNQTSKAKGQTYFKLDSVLEQMPALYFLGFLNGTQSGSTQINEFYARVLKDKLSKKELLKLEKDMLKEINKFQLFLKN